MKAVYLLCKGEESGWPDGIVANEKTEQTMTPHKRRTTHKHGQIGVYEIIRQTFVSGERSNIEQCGFPVAMSND